MGIHAGMPSGLRLAANSGPRPMLFKSKPQRMMVLDTTNSFGGNKKAQSMRLGLCSTLFQPCAKRTFSHFPGSFRESCRLATANRQDGHIKLLRMITLHEWIVIPPFPIAPLRPSCFASHNWASSRGRSLRLRGDLWSRRRLGFRWG